MPILDAIAELIHAAVQKSECVGFFAIILILLVIMHAQNTRRLDDLRERFREHEEGCPGRRT